MNHHHVSTIAFLCTAAMTYAGFKLQFSDWAMATAVFSATTVFLLGILNRKRFRHYALQKHDLPLEASAEQLETLVWYESRDAHKRLFSLGKFFLLALVVIMLVGCGGQILYVEYGLDRMASTDKVRLNGMLSDNPDGRRESWYNKSSNSQYTVTMERSYFNGGKLCRQYLIDDVYPYNAVPRHRGHMQIREYACWDEHQGRWFATDHWNRAWVDFAGPYSWQKRRTD